MDLLKLLPKTNCGQCGEATCLLFSLKVFAKKLSPKACPYLGENIMPDPNQEAFVFNQMLENLRYIKEKFKNITDFTGRAENLGCIRLDAGKFLLPYLDFDIEIEIDEQGRPSSINELSEKKFDPRDEILIYNYFIFDGKAPLTGDYVGLESFPHSISKVKTLRLYAETPLAELFSNFRSSINELLKGFRVSDFEDLKGGFSFRVAVLPKVILKIVYWEGSEEEGLASECKVLYDRHALYYLDLECLVFSAERFAERFREQLKLN